MLFLQRPTSENNNNILTRFSSERINWRHSDDQIGAPYTYGTWRINLVLFDLDNGLLTKWSLGDVVVITNV